MLGIACDTFPIVVWQCYQSWEVCYTSMSALFPCLLFQHIRPEDHNEGFFNSLFSPGTTCKPCQKPDTMIPNGLPSCLVQRYLISFLPQQTSIPLFVCWLLPVTSFKLMPHSTPPMEHVNIWAGKWLLACSKGEGLCKEETTLACFVKDNTITILDLILKFWETFFVLAGFFLCSGRCALQSHSVF